MRSSRGTLLIKRVIRILNFYILLFILFVCQRTRPHKCLSVALSLSIPYSHSWPSRAWVRVSFACRRKGAMEKWEAFLERRQLPAPADPWMCRNVKVRKCILNLFLFSFLLTALVDLYEATRGPQWTYHSNWMSGDPCQGMWHGVRCDYSNSSVDIL